MKKAAWILMMTGVCSVFGDTHSFARTGAQRVEGSFQFVAEIPANGISCQDEATALGTRFSTATGVAADSAQCLGESTLTAENTGYPIYSLAVSYQAKEEMIPYVAKFGHGDLSSVPTDTAGIYTAYAQCLSDIAIQSRLFEVQTGLSSVTASCKLGRVGSPNSYVLEVTGFGEPKSRLSIFEPTYLGLSDSELKEQVAGVIESLGGKIALRIGDAVLYYSARALPVYQESVMFFADRSQCTAQLGEAVAIFSALSSTSVIVRCLVPAEPELSGAGTMEVVRVNGDITESDFGSGSIQYYSFSDCMKDRDRVIAQATSQGRTIAGGLCHEDTSNSQIFVLELYY